MEVVKEEEMGPGDRAVIAEATKAGFLDTGGGFPRAEGSDPHLLLPPPPPPPP